MWKENSHIENPPKVFTQEFYYPSKEQNKATRKNSEFSRKGRIHKGKKTYVA